MKIIFVSDAIYPYNKGGKEKRLYEISTRLAKCGHRIHIYCMKWWKKNENERIENRVHLHAISKYYPLYSGKRRSIREAIMFSLACFKLIKEDFDAIDVDHMPHLVLFPIKFVCLIKRKKLIATWNEVWGKKYWRKYLGKLGTIAYFIEWLSARMPDKIISVSEHTKTGLIEKLKIKKEIAVISNGIDLAKIQKVKSAEDKSDVIFAGRLLNHKNVDVLIRSIRLVREKYLRVKCLIIGDGPEKKKLEQLSEKLGLKKNMHFLGFLGDQRSVYSLIKSAKVFVLPSTREGFGIVVIEANACGIPVITINHKNNAAKDLIEEGKNGYICQLDEKEIAKRIADIFAKGFDNQIKQICVDSARKYDWDKIVTKIEEVYLK